MTVTDLTEPPRDPLVVDAPAVARARDHLGALEQRQGVVVTPLAPVVHAHPVQDLRRRKGFVARRVDPHAGGRLPEPFTHGSGIPVPSPQKKNDTGLSIGVTLFVTLIASGGSQCGIDIATRSGEAD